MAISPDELPALLRAIQARVREAPVPVVNAIAGTYEDHLVNVTLAESGSHGPATAAGYPPAAPPGRPPMEMPGGLNGSLRGSVQRTPGSGGGAAATASVYPDVIYAATLEWGAEHVGRPEMWLWVSYVGPRVTAHKHWVRTHVHIREHPYMRTAVAETIADGSLSRAAARSFTAAVWS